MEDNNYNKTLNINSPLFFPICIYHYNNLDINMPMSYLQPGTRYINDVGDISFRCPFDSNGVYGNWLPEERFFVINPMFRPIPTGMNLIRVKRKDSYPYNITNVSIVYDPFDLNDKDVYFISFTLPVPYTTNLYLHKYGNSIYPSFSPHPPTKDVDWGFAETPNLFVFLDPKGKKFDSDLENIKGISTKKTFDTEKNGMPIFTFINVNGRCLPNPDGERLEDCILKNENLMDPTQKDKPPTLLELLKQESLTDNNIKLKSSDGKKYTYIFVFTMILLVFLFLSVLLLLLFRNKK